VTDPHVTLVVATHNRREQLLASVARHRALPERPRVIVVDDASTDGTADALAGVEVIRRRTNIGGAARNAGVRAATTPYVALTDDDAWWKPGALRAAAEVLDRHPRLAVLQAHVLVGPDNRDDPTCEEMRDSPLPPAPGQPGRPILSFVACAAVIRRDAFLACGGFSPRLGVGGEEELLSWDLAAAGWQLSYVPEVIAHHHPPPAKNGRPARNEATIRNALWTAWLRRPLGAAARVTAGAVVRAPSDPVTARALRAAVTGGGWTLRERRVNPPHVERLRCQLDRDGTHRR
jgi:N-acetylglucosaminyl-diphospho-decaprenol L-rhamnosyltransferase